MVDFFWVRMRVVRLGFYHISQWSERGLNFCLTVNLSPSLSKSIQESYEVHGGWSAAGDVGHYADSGGQVGCSQVQYPHLFARECCTVFAKRREEYGACLRTFFKVVVVWCNILHCSVQHCHVGFCLLFPLNHLPFSLTFSSMLQDSHMPPVGNFRGNATATSF